jgi:hypothetical protein
MAAVFSTAPHLGMRCRDASSFYCRTSIGATKKVKKIFLFNDLNSDIAGCRSQERLARHLQDRVGCFRVLMSRSIAWEVGSTTSSTWRRSASRFTSFITGNRPYAPVPMTSWRHFRSRRLPVLVLQVLFQQCSSDEADAWLRTHQETIDRSAHRRIVFG